MYEYRNTIGAILISIFTVVTGFVVAECAIADLTAGTPQMVVETYEALIKGLNFLMDKIPY